MNHLARLAVAVIGAIVAVGCNKQESTPTPPPPTAQPDPETDVSPKVEIKVMADGSVFLDGRPATLATIDGRLAELAGEKGVVWYYREGGRSEPPPVALKVIDLVARHRLPVSLSSRPDFSDVVDGTGTSHPRR